LERELEVKEKYVRAGSLNLLEAIALISSSVTIVHPSLPMIMSTL